MSASKEKRTNKRSATALPDPGPAREQWDAILQQRARELAAPPEQTSGETTIEVVCLQLAGAVYAMETGFVREVYPLKDLTPLPCTPPFVAGIVNVRGQVLSVLDLAALLELPAPGIGELNKVVILADEQMEFGILADAILDVRTLPLRALQPGLPTHSGKRERYLKGISGDGLVVLDAGRLLRDPGIVVNEEIA